jgi:hypothetical protein
MNWRAFLYCVLVAGGIVAGSLAVRTIDRSGSSAVPGWTDVVRPGALSPKHAFLADRCEACHTPLRGAEASSCILCHANDAAILAKQSTAFHATIQSCSACHVEHQDAVRPVRMDHDALVAIARRQGGPTKTSPVDDLLSTLGGTEATSTAQSLDCFSCHSNRSPHRDLLGQQCAACHAVSTWKIAGYKHPSAASTDCAQCHQAPPSHYMGHFEMVSRRVAGQEHARVEQCYLCHQTDAWNDIRGVGWYKHH